jgi:hypothetical protein
VAGVDRLARDHYIRLDSNDYSVHPAAIGRRVEVSADLARVRVLAMNAKAHPADFLPGYRPCESSLLIGSRTRPPTRTGKGPRLQDRVQVVLAVPPSEMPAPPAPS